MAVSYTHLDVYKRQFDHAYHGRTNLTLAMTAKNMPYKHRFGPFASELYRVPMAYPYRWPGGPQHCADEAFSYIIDQIHAQIGEENTCLLYTSRCV